MSNSFKAEYENKINSLNLDIKGGCNRCIHHLSKMDFINDELKLVKSCKIGNNATVNEWWIDNGKKYSNDPTTTNNECFEASIHEKALTNMNNITKDLLNELNEHENK